MVTTGTKDADFGKTVAARRRRDVDEKVKATVVAPAMNEGDGSDVLLARGHFHESKKP